MVLEFWVQSKGKHSSADGTLLQRADHSFCWIVFVARLLDEFMFFFQYYSDWFLKAVVDIEMLSFLVFSVRYTINISYWVWPRILYGNIPRLLGVWLFNGCLNPSLDRYLIWRCSNSWKPVTL